MKHCWLLVASRSYQNAIGITEAQQICVGGLLQVKTFQPDIKGRTQAVTFGGKILKIKKKWCSLASPVSKDFETTDEIKNRESNNFFSC